MHDHEIGFLMNDSVNFAGSVTIRYTSMNKRCVAASLRRRRAHAEIGDEMAVHDVDVQAFDAGPLRVRDLLAQPAKSAAEWRARWIARVMSYHLIRRRLAAGQPGSKNRRG